MCYTGRCQWETYPWGTNEGCVCTAPTSQDCPMMQDGGMDDSESNFWENEDDEES